jgi:hypothetical protein
MHVTSITSWTWREVTSVPDAETARPWFNLGEKTKSLPSLARSGDMGPHHMGYCVPCRTFFVTVLQKTHKPASTRNNSDTRLGRYQQKLGLTAAVSDELFTHGNSYLMFKNKRVRLLIGGKTLERYSRSIDVPKPWDARHHEWQQSTHSS